jgi:hypothetical protein
MTIPIMQSISAKDAVNPPNSQSIQLNDRIADSRIASFTPGEEAGSPESARAISINSYWSGKRSHTW